MARLRDGGVGDLKPAQASETRQGKRKEKKEEKELGGLASWRLAAARTQVVTRAGGGEGGEGWRGWKRWRVSMYVVCRSGLHVHLLLPMGY